MPGKIYDVIIIGAGPAGLACARELAGSDLSVLILDKRKILGSKPCGGGICEKELAVPYERSWSKEISTQTITLKNTSINIRHRYKRITFEREDLASYQERLLYGAENITLVKDVQVTEIREDKVITAKGDYRYKYLVGADGTASIVRNYLKLPSRLAFGMYYRIWGEYNNFVGYYDTDTMGPGYIWEFPHPKYNNIGIYFEPEFLTSVKAKQLLQNYLTGKGYKYDEKDFLAAPVNYNYLGYHFGNIFLAGDAGGFTSRMHGGGMSNAIISGTETARLIKDPAYKPAELEKMLKEKLRDDKLIDYYAKLPHWLSKALIFLFINLYRLPFFQRILPL